MSTRGSDLPDHSKCPGLLQLRLRLRFDVEKLRGHKLAIAEGSAVGCHNRLTFGPELVGRNAEAACRLGDQNLAHLGGGVADRRAAVLHRLTAGGEALVGRPSGVGGDQFDLAGRDLQLLGRHLEERGADTLAELGLAREDGDAAIGVDPDPGIEEGHVVEATRQLGRRRRTGLPRLLCPGARQEREADDERAGTDRARFGGRCRLCSRVCVIPWSSHRSASRPLA